MVPPSNVKSQREVIFVEARLEIRRMATKSAIITSKYLK
jgi:hypothetical protein